MLGKITNRSVEALRPGAFECRMNKTGWPERDFFIWDSELRGFGVKVTPKGRRIYILQYSKEGRIRRFTIGEHGPFKAEKARDKAETLKGYVADGKDPAVERAIERGLPTVEEFTKRYLEEYADLHKKASSATEDRRNINNHIVPLLGWHRIDEVTRDMVARAIRDVRSGKTARDEKTEKKRGRRHVRGGASAANRTLALLSKMFNLAEEWGLRHEGSNPCRHVTKFPERKRERFLSFEEIKRLGEAIARTEKDGTIDPIRLAAIRLLLFTGCRLREVLTLKWEHVDFERGLLRLPDSKTGAKAVYLSPAAKQVLTALPRQEGIVYVLPRLRRSVKDETAAIPPIKQGVRIRRQRSAKRVRVRENFSISGLQKTWNDIRKSAKLEGVRIHDLRHSFASIGAGAGLSLPIIGALLGHSQPQTTARYAHLAATPQHQAVDLIGNSITAALAGKEPAEVMQFKKKRR